MFIDNCAKKGYCKSPYFIISGIGTVWQIQSDSYKNTFSAKIFVFVCFADVENLNRYLTTASGFTLDEAIQVGVDNPGKPWQRASGIIAGDCESYEVFAPLFDAIIRECHGHKKIDFHPRDMDSRKIVDGQLNSNYVLSARLHTRRSIRGYCLPAGCSRGARRNLEGLIRMVIMRLGGEWSQGEGH